MQGDAPQVEGGAHQGVRILPLPAQGVFDQTDPIRRLQGLCLQGCEQWQDARRRGAAGGGLSREPGFGFLQHPGGCVRIVRACRVLAGGQAQGREQGGEQGRERADRGAACRSAQCRGAGGEGEPIMPQPRDLGTGAA